MESKTEAEKFVTICIRVHKSPDHIFDILSSIRTQTIVDVISVIIADDTHSEYDEIVKMFPDLDITVLTVDDVTDPSANEHIIRACKTKWITFRDENDVLNDPQAIYDLVWEIKANFVVVSNMFMRDESDERFTSSPWVYGVKRFHDCIHN